MSENEAEDARQLLESITEGLKGRAKHYKVTKAFAEKTAIGRQDLLLLDSVVKSYDALCKMDAKIAENHAAWLVACGKTSEQLDNENHNLSPKNMGDLLEQYCDISDKVEAQFKQILEQYPENIAVETHLARFKDEFGSQDFDLNPKVYSKIIFFRFSSSHKKFGVI